MKNFQYEGISPSGAPVNGVIRARDAGDAEYQLREKLRSVTKLEETQKENILDRFSSKKINEKELAMVCQQFSIIMNAGMPIVRTVELVAEQTTDKNIHAILTDVAEDVAAGFSMADSFSRRGPQLPSTFVETVRAGEESGSLEIAFESLSTYFGKRNATRQKLVSALTYPAFVIVVAIFVIAIIMVKAVPVFIESFADIGVELPLPTRMLISVSNFFQKYIWIMLALLALVIVAVRVYDHTEKGHLEIAQFKLQLPILGKLQLMTAASEFANTLSTMLATGVPTIRALGITGRSLTNYYMGSSVLNMVEKVESGFPIGDTMRKDGTFPNLLCEMTAMGEESGSLESTLKVISDYYDNEVDTASTRAVTLLEPITICVLAVFVVWVLLAVYLPMFNMYGSI